LEIISSAGFERFFVELAALLDSAPDDAAVAALNTRYGVQSDPGSVARLIAKHDLIAGGGPD
jgi:hypothetical protein